MTLATRSRLWLAAGALLLACRGPEGLTAVNENGDQIPLRVVADLRQPDSSQTPVAIEAASIRGDTLHLRLLYSGGCVPAHDLGLAASGRLVQSDPPQVTMILRHDGHGDTCRAGVNPNVVADLRLLRTIAEDHTSLRIQLYEPWALEPVDALLLYNF